MALRKLKSAFLPRRVRNVLHGPTVPLALRVAFSSSCLRQAYQALESRRQEQHSTAFQQAYALRAGIDQTISQGTRRTRMRRSPYRGERKTHLHHVQIAAGINVLRIITHRRCTSGRASLRVLNVEPLPLLVSRRWLDGDIQLSEHHFPTESLIPGMKRRSLCAEVRWREVERTRMLDRGDPACYYWNMFHLENA